MKKSPINGQAAKGGRARAKSLSAEERRDIAERAAAARWEKQGKQLPKAVHEAPLTIGNITFDCAVLDDGNRVISQSNFMESMGMYYSGWIATKRDRIGEPADLPHFLGFKSLKPYVDRHLGDMQSITMRYKSKKGGVGHGIKAQIIPKICEIWLDARKNEKQLGARQEAIADKAELLIRAFAHVGIIALIDEATGYQYERQRTELQEFLKEFLSDELRRWVRTFPAEYFKQLCRLKNVTYRPDMQLPPYFGTITNDIVYKRLAPDVLNELRKKNIDPETGKRKGRLHQWLSEDIGHPKLLQHLGLCIGLMRISPDWDTFKKYLDEAAPILDGVPLLAYIHMQNQ